MIKSIMTNSKRLVEKSPDVQKKKKSHHLIFDKSQIG